MLPAEIRHRLRLERRQDRVPGLCWIWQAREGQRRRAKQLLSEAAS